ncbi:FTR1 family protein [Herbaspirillum sp. ST 5-3]|uniref:FTR1 family iron permease n=1 Tax=Oxalobacteraceae TaxID=75682 RepID=UPI0010A57E8D|nr:FTR1 family protein [Herbaspirillum sp. ST 5-3]
MFGSAIIVFRETLEAALLIGIIAASTRGLDYRNRWLGIGIAAGMIGSLIVAWLTESIADMFEGNGQEIFKAVVLGIAVVMIGWHNIWMASHGKEMAARAKNVGNAIRSGQQELSAIAIAIALTVLREGSEAALFLQGMLASTTDGAGSVVMGGLLGMIAGASIGMITYFGLLRIPLSRFFSVTGTLLLLLAAGLASQMAKFLIQADLLPSLASPLWDTSWILPVTSNLGSALAILLGYEDKPTGMQAIFYFATLACIYIGASWTHRNATPSSQKLKSA